MRAQIAMAYESECGFCVHDGSIGAVSVGLEAAHVRWRAFGSPDSSTGASSCRRTSGKRRDTKSMVTCMATKKVTVTIPEELLDEIRVEAAERGMSAYVAEALRFKRDRDRLQELADWLQEEHGPVTEDEHAAALEDLEGLDAEHARRRAAGGHHAGEAA